MRKAFLCVAALVCLAADLAAQTATLTCTLKDPSAATVSSRTFLRVELKGCGGNQPTVPSAPAELVPLSQDFLPNGSGLVSTTIYKNDAVFCGGSNASSFYVLTLFRDGLAQPSGTHRITAASAPAGSYDCTHTALSSLPVSDAPSSSFRLGSLVATGDASITGNVTIGGSETITGSVSPSANGTQTLGDSFHRWDMFTDGLDLGGKVTGDVQPLFTSGQSLGSSTNHWNLFADALTAYGVVNLLGDMVVGGQSVLHDTVVEGSGLFFAPDDTLCLGCGGNRPRSLRVGSDGITSDGPLLITGINNLSVGGNVQTSSSGSNLAGSVTMGDLAVGNTGGIIMTGSNEFQPLTDNVAHIGDASHRFADLYATALHGSSFTTGNGSILQDDATDIWAFRDPSLDFAHTGIVRFYGFATNTTNQFDDLAIGRYAGGWALATERGSSSGHNSRIALIADSSIEFCPGILSTGHKLATDDSYTCTPQVTIDNNGNLLGNGSSSNSLGTASAPFNILRLAGITGLYQGVNTAGLGQPVVRGDQEANALTTAVGTTTVVASVGNDATYRINMVAACHSSAASATVTPTYIYTDPSGTVHTVPLASATCTTLGAASVTGTSAIVRVKAATNIQFSIAIANSPTYDYSMTVEQLTSI